MMPLVLIVTTCLIHLTWAYSDDLYPLSDTEALYSYPEDIPDDNDLDIHRRNSNFLRFGRSGRPHYDAEYDDYNEDFARPTRSGKIEKNDHFIRFGRSKQDFLRFGRDQERPVRAKNELHLRFGRAMPELEEKTRNKRETYSEFKRSGSNFLRFGRNSNFLRFGRNNEMANVDIDKNQVSSLIQLLTEIVGNMKKEENKNSRNV